MSELLELRDVSKWFPAAGKRLVAVDHIDLTLAAGESLGIVGESGCGKSTLSRLVSRLLDVSAGSMVFRERDIGRIPFTAFAGDADRKAIQIVFQDPNDALNPIFTAARSIAEPLISLMGVKRRGAIAARVEALAREVELAPELLGRRPHQLSGGQKARVGIARALASEPDLLVLDEPTAALDASVQAVILRLLTELRRKRGMSYLFISHDFDVIRLMCDRVVVMYLGRIVETGPVAEILSRPAHPYTKALIGAIRDPRHNVPAPGEASSPIDPDPIACRFYGRCPRRSDLCLSKPQILEAVGVNTFVACHHPNEFEASR